MNIALAPMEGVVDPILRDLLTRIGGIDYCVTEFVRVSSRVLPESVFLKLCPELENGGCTPSGVPVHVQLLGSHPERMAQSAAVAAGLGAPVIDLNFGCPAKTVNKHRGGAVLLDTPDDIHEIVAAVRQAVPADIPVTAKMRLGVKDKSLAIDNAQAIEAAGAAKLTVHARTKVEGYRPPAHWHWLAKIREAVSLPVVANGEIWTPEDYMQCREVSGCKDVMIGRGLISSPGLANEIILQRQQLPSHELPWHEVLASVCLLFEMSHGRMMPKYVHGRVKQWLNQLKRQYPEAKELFESIKTLRDCNDLERALKNAQEKSLILV